MKRTILATIFLISLLFLIGADDSDIEKEKARVKALDMDVRSMYGLDGFYVLIGSLNEDANEISLTEEQLRTDIELKLRLAGINVLSEEESFNVPAMQYLAFYAHIMNRDGLIIYNVDLNLNQRMKLIRGFEVFERIVESRLVGTTWKRGGMGSVGATKANEAIRDYAKDLTDKFINDYLKANPKK